MIIIEVAKISHRLREIISNTEDLSAQSHIPVEWLRRHCARISELFPILHEKQNSVLGPQPYRAVPNHFDLPARSRSCGSHKLKTTFDINIQYYQL